MPLETDLSSLLVDLKLIVPGEVVDAAPLPGGVSSDIVLVTTASGRRFCIKRALPRLKVATLWEAPVGRNAAEAKWLRTVARWLPEVVPALIADDPGRGLFAMEYLPADTHPVWKGELLAGHADAAFSRAVGAALVSIHGHSAAKPALAAAFDNETIFEPIRIEPYLRATARAHPDLAKRLERLAERTLATRLALIHGDVSPKNILHGPQGPVFLDAECACWGDPAFDLAFCLTHLLLKGALREDHRVAYLGCFAAFARAYLDGVTWEAREAIEGRAADLVQAFLLARVDGRSPVEYLDEPRRDWVRQAARTMLLGRTKTLDTIADLWSRLRA